MDFDDDFNEYNDGKDDVYLEDQNYQWNNSGPPPPPYLRKPNRRNARYGEAFGEYSGGYGPGGGFFPPRGPPPLMWGQGFGPRGPPMRRAPMDDRAIGYLTRCGVPKEHLKNLPRSLLALMEPQHCGLCSMSFESFAMSRMHYISKNHIKKQKKWILQYRQGGILQHLETPMKSRDLYCELCDVHITSKIHADSHYSGKQHKSIVEGRKIPKNPILLQRGMEGRLEQLIRREKKFYKANNDVAVEEENAKEKQNNQSEFYCDICKTSMTCSEQMTMHLNGKRHLNKEKQHILKMMKGGAGDATEGDNVGEPEEAAEQDKTGEEEQNATAEDNFDWGQGSGEWETEGKSETNQGSETGV